MTGNISPVNTAYVQDALKYVNGQSVSNSGILQDVADSFTSVPTCSVFTAALFGGGEILKKTSTQATSLFTGQPATTIFGNVKYKRAGLKGLSGTMKNLGTATKSAELNKLLANSKGLSGAAKNYEITNLVKDMVKSGDANTIKKVEKIIKKSGGDVDKALEKLSKAAGTSAKAAKPSKISKIWNWAKGTPIGDAIVNSGPAKSAGAAINKFLTTNSVGKAISKGAGKFSKAFKTSGAGIMLASDGVMALFTDVVPAFSQGGFKEGVKQTAKSAVKVGASTAGWVAGSTVGKAVGAAIGGAIGSAVPIVGNALGAWIGGFVGDVVGGSIGSAIAGKVAEKVVGKDYTDKVADQQVEMQAAQICQDSASMSQLNSTVYSMVQQDMADDGKLSKDSQKMLEYLQSGSGNASYASTGYSYAAVNNDLNTLISRIQSGDTSVYTVPDEVLNASARGSYASLDGSFANNYTNFGYTNPYATSSAGGNEVINYFG